MDRLRLAGACGLLAALVAGCAARHPQAEVASSGAPAPLSSAYAAAAARGESVYRLDPQASQVLVLVGKAGPFAAAGHVHAIVVTGLEGYARISPRTDRADLVFPVRGLVVDPPAVRSALGGAYAEPLDEAARRGTRAHMLGQSVLDAGRYPRVRLAVSARGPVAATLALQVRVTLHGVTRTFATRARCARMSGALLADGSFDVLQSDFGIEPYTILFGALRVRDRLEIRYHLDFRRWYSDPIHAQPQALRR